MIKNLRLIELFAGYGSQALALKYLGVPFEHHFVCEFDKYAIQSYNDIHGTDFEVLDIRNIHAGDLNIIETNKYKYLMTYSFPCTDLSVAGKRAGMERESGTSSSLLWEVERLLKECNELPQYLLMENVPMVISKDNIKLFGEWTGFLTKLGYDNYYQLLNAKDYGVPQNRERCFMVSILKSEHKAFAFPKPKPLEIRLKDVLEDNVDEKYYLTSEKAQRLIYQLAKTIMTGDESAVILKWNKNMNVELKCVGQMDGSFESANRVYDPNGLSPTTTCYHTDAGVRILEERESSLKIKNATKQGYLEAKPGDSVGIGGRMEWHRANVMNGIAKTLICSENDVGVVAEDYRIRKLTPKECFRLMGVKDGDYDKLTVSNTQRYKQAGNSIVVDVLMAIFENMFIKDCKSNRLF